MFLGIDLGGTHIKAVLLNESGQVVHEKQLATCASEGTAAVMAKLSALIVDADRGFPGELQRIGLAVPGVLDQERKRVVLLPNFPDSWHGFELREHLMLVTGQEVELINDARAAAFAELNLGAGRGISDFLLLVLGTGVGGGVVLKGELILGSRGVAGELGHQVIQPDGLLCGCGNRGCLETIASGPAIASAAIRVLKQGLPTLMRELVQDDVSKVNSSIVDEAAVRGDRFAIDILKGAANALVQAIRNGIAILNPGAVIIGGGVARSGFLLDLVRRGLESRVILFPSTLGGVDVVEAVFGTYAGAVGAAAWAMSRRTS
ncbi:ROK family protein [Paenibacillus glycanilyticus]|uniref:ROK family protein n=1 Tax=Paenibacillus glycanilyticus TaxID=126569 RepID=UPI000FD9B6F5|nr:ROK family protein [Paenibacillus glycanilyticus]